MSAKQFALAMPGCDEKSIREISQGMHQFIDLKLQMSVDEVEAFLNPMAAN
tara:strand:+ start:308 stop:460 length:153 start_codon:yes stop_codon:yes gene_type:complete